MNGLEKITARIERDARAEIAEQRNAAAAESEKLRAEAEAKAAERLAIGRAENKAAAETHYSRLIAAFGMEERQRQLQCKQSYIDKAFALAEQQVLSAEEETLVERLSDYIVSASDRGEIWLSEENRARFGEKLLQRALEKKPGAGFTLAEGSCPTDGVILRDGRIEYNGSVSTRFRELRTELAYEVAETLFGA